MTVADSAAQHNAFLGWESRVSRIPERKEAVGKMQEDFSSFPNLGNKGQKEKQNLLSERKTKKLKH